MKKFTLVKNRNRVWEFGGRVGAKIEGAEGVRDIIRRPTEPPSSVRPMQTPRD